MASFFFSSGIWRSLKWEYRRSFSSSLLLPPTACVRVVSWCRCCSSRGQRSVLECLCSLRLFTSKCVVLHLTFLKDTNRKNMVHRDNIWLGYIVFGYLVKHGVFEMENRNDPGNRKCLYSVTHSIDLSFIWNSQTLSIKISPYRFLELRLTSCLPKNWTLLWPSVSAGCVWSTRKACMEELQFFGSTPGWGFRPGALTLQIFAPQSHTLSSATSSPTCRAPKQKGLFVYDPLKRQLAET